MFKASLSGKTTSSVKTVDSRRLEILGEDRNRGQLEEDLWEQQNNRTTEQQNNRTTEQQNNS